MSSIGRMYVSTSSSFELWAGLSGREKRMKWVSSRFLFKEMGVPSSSLDKEACPLVVLLLRAVSSGRLKFQENPMSPYDPSD